MRAAAMYSPSADRSDRTRRSRSRLPPRASRSALVDRRVLAQLLARVDLPRTADLRVLVLDHLFPVSDPPRQPAEGEHHGEHVGRDAERAIDDARVEVDV